jgi:hypothetical protein
MSASAIRTANPIIPLMARGKVAHMSPFTKPMTAKVRPANSDAVAISFSSILCIQFSQLLWGEIFVHSNIFGWHIYEIMCAALNKIECFRSAERS